MVAMRWPVGVRRSGISIRPTLAMIEFKFREAALGGTSGIRGHVEKLRDMLALDPGFFAELADEMSDVFNQRVELGLVQCHKNGFMRTIQAIDSSRPECIILLADHYPASSELATALDEVAKMQSGLQFEVKIATANFMGYALYGECISTLDDFRARYSSQIRSRVRVCPPSKTP